MPSDFLNPESYDNGGPIWAISGYQDDSGRYHDFTEMSESQLETEYASNFFPEVDYVVIEWFDAQDHTLQHATIVGPFDDFEDLDDRVETYFEEGTP